MPAATMSRHRIQPRPLHPVTGRPSLIIDIYCRISVDYDGTERSVKSQEDDCTDAIEEREAEGWTVGTIFRDHAKSAWNPKVVRKDWEMLMARLESGASDGVMVYDLSRFTRKPMEGERLITAAEHNLVVASIENTYNLRDPDGRAHFRNDMTAAARESDKISQRTKRGKKKKAKAGKSNAGRRAYGEMGYDLRPQGWTKGDDMPPLVSEQQVEYERTIIDEMGTRILAGETLNSIIRDLIRRNVKTVNGKNFTAVTMRQILSRPSVTGLVEYDGKIIGEIKNREAAMPRDRWDDLQRHWSAKRVGRPATAYLLSGIMHCSRCGEKMQGRPRPTRPEYEPGVVAREYWCIPRAHGGGCGRMVVDMRFANSMVKEGVLAKLGDPDHSERMATLAQESSNERAPLDAQLKKLASDRLAVASKIADMGYEWTETATTAIDKKIVQVQAKLDAMAHVDLPKVSADQVRLEWERAESDGDIKVLRELVKEAFPNLTLLPKPEGSYFKAQTQTVARFDWDGLSLGLLGKTA